MDTGIKTPSRRDKTAWTRTDPLYAKYPPEYYGYALQWCHYTKWTIEEAANLLTGCIPHRKMFLPGDEHARLDEEILATENRIRGALGAELTTIQGKKYFERTYINSIELVDWARQCNIVIPDELLMALRETQMQRSDRGYSTPCLEAIEWVIQSFWVGTDLRHPPSPGKIIQSLLQKFPNLTAEECEMVERVTRHPVATTDEAD